ncbi:MAG: transposase [Thermodesulfobacteriota bacterium]|nr:transposase [Thermodesulfobacteriota bacterium]
MARPYRLQGEGCFYHITDRGDDRKKIYISEYDYKQFLKYLLLAKDKFKFYLYAYCLMPNHYHFLLETPQPNLAKIMHYINTSYTTYYNVKRKKSGHLFQGRYKSIVVDKDNYFLELSRYIHLNPVRAKIVKRPEEYKWSSYNGYMRKKGDGYIDKGQINIYLDMKSNRYKQFVLDGISKETDPLRDIYAGFILGVPSFIKDKLEDLKVQIESDDISHRKTINKNTDIEEIAGVVAEKYGKDREKLYRLKKKPLLARKMAVYLSKRLTGLMNKEIGNRFLISYSAVSKAAKDVERLMQENKGVKRDVEMFISHFKG